MLKAAVQRTRWAAALRGSMLFAVLCVQGVEAQSVPSAVSSATVISGVTVLTMTKGVIEDGTVIIENGKITAMGKGLPTPAGAKIIDARGKYLMPGLINPHSHTGIYPLLGMAGNLDLSESQGNIHSDIRALDAFNTADPEIARAVSGGVTTIQSLPGSDNNVGGWTVVVKLNGAAKVEDALFPGAPPGMKWAWGENPKTEHRGQGDHPATLMGETAAMRQRFLDAQDYAAKWKAWENGGKKGTPPERDLQLEGLAEVLAGKVRVHVHAYQPSQFEALFRLSDEFHFPIAAIHHALGAFMVAPELERRNIGVVTFGDYWGYKVEAWDAIPQNAYLLWKSGVVVSMHTDSPVMEDQDYMLQASIVHHYGVPEEAALQMVTINPAKILGVEKRVGSIEPGKDADLAIWSGDPIEVTSKVEMVFIDGKQVYARGEGFLPWR